ncbi:hypothetical protein HMPREF1870_02821, partial [Bacteroidales bacterium KA00344]
LYFRPEIRKNSEIRILLIINAFCKNALMCHGWSFAVKYGMAIRKSLKRSAVRV